MLDKNNHPAKYLFGYLLLFSMFGVETITQGTQFNFRGLKLVKRRIFRFLKFMLYIER